MAYTRTPESGHYIWSDGNELTLDDKYVSEELIDIFIYKLYLGKDKEEFFERYNHGKELVFNFLKNELKSDDEKNRRMAQEHLDNLMQIEENVRS